MSAAVARKSVHLSRSKLDGIVNNIAYEEPKKSKRIVPSQLPNNIVVEGPKKSKRFALVQKMEEGNTKRNVAAKGRHNGKMHMGSTCGACHEIYPHGVFDPDVQSSKYVCPDAGCQNAFPNRRAYEDHLELFQKVKDSGMPKAFKCQHPGCGVKFSQRKNLMKHIDQFHN